MSNQAFDANFESLLTHLKETRGFDFSAYKRSTLMRRVRKRMSMVHTASFSDYIHYLEVHPDEFVELFNTILINVTGFFRDTSSWDYLSSEIVPRVIDANRGEAIRIWSAGCASGEEAYTLAIVFAEAMGAEEFRRRVKIYATDADEDALSMARQGIYGLRELQPVSEELRQRYFEPLNERYAFRRDLRRTIIFGRHDLIQARRSLASTCSSRATR